MVIRGHLGRFHRPSFSECVEKNAGSVKRPFVATAAGLAMLSSVALPWLEAGVGPGTSSQTAGDIPLLAVAVVGCGLTVLSLSAAWWVTGSGRWTPLIVIAAGFILFVTAILLVTVECLSGLIPVSLIPSTLRRTSPILDAGVGLWLALVAAVASIGAVLISRLTWIDRRAWMRSENRGKLVATVLLVAMSAVVAWLRYEPWLASSIFGRAFDLPGQAEPWIGPLSLLALLLLGVSVLLALFLCTVVAGLLAAASGWLITFLAAMTVISADVLAEIRIGDVVGGSTSNATELTAHATFALWATFGTGIGVAMLGAYLVSWRPRFGGE